MNWWSFDEINGIISDVTGQVLPSTVNVGSNSQCGRVCWKRKSLQSYINNTI